MTGRRRKSSTLGIRRARVRPGAVLLEVIFSLLLFVVAAVAVVGGLNACIQASGEVRLAAQAADLAVTKVSEIQMGLVPAVDTEPTPFEEEGLTDWTWQIVTEPVENNVLELPSMLRVHVIVANGSRNYSYRLTHLMPQEAENPDQAASGSSQGGGP
jgi:hypothetical protein